MRIFITGATGFIGRHLCESLVSQGHQIVALVRSEEKARLLPSKNIELLKGNLSSFKKADFKIPACNVVVHLAGIITAKRPVYYYRTNFDAVVDLVHCLERQSWKPNRFIFCSSLAAAGPSWAHHALTESDDTHPVDDYGRSKRMAEDFLLEQHSFPVTVVRPPIVIGPYDTNIFNLYKIAKKGLALLPRGEDQLLSFVSVDDFVRATGLLFNDSSTDHRLYFVTNEHPSNSQTIWNEVARTLNKKISFIRLPRFVLFLTMKTNMLLGRLGRQCVFDKKYYDQLCAEAWVCSAQNLKKDFGWEALDSLPQIFDKTAQSYKQLGWI